MRRVLLLLLLAASALAQEFPTTIATNLPAAADNAVATLLTSIDSSTTVVTLTTPSTFAANVPFKVDNEQIKCTVFSGSQFSNCLRGYSGTARASHSASGATCAEAPYFGCARGIVVAEHFNAPNREIVAIEQALGANMANVVRINSGKPVGVGAIPFGCGAIGTVCGDTNVFGYDFTFGRLGIGSYLFASPVNKLLVTGTDYVHALVAAGAGNYWGALEIRSGGGGGTNDHSFLRFSQGGNAKWDVIGVLDGQPYFEIRDITNSFAPRLTIDPIIKLLQLQPLDGNVDILANTTGTALATGRVDWGNSTSTRACKTGTSTPAQCIVGDCFFDSDETAGKNLYLCTALNAWTQLIGTGGVTTGGGYNAGFTSQTTLTIAAATHLMTACPANVTIWSVSGSTITYSPSYKQVSCDTTSLAVTVAFEAATSGMVYLIGQAGGSGGGGGGGLMVAGAPASSTAACTTGTARFDGAYVYVCVSTNSWGRSLLTRW